MSFRRRIALLTGAAVAVSILLASTLAYVTVRGQLLGQVDDSLRTRAGQIADGLQHRLLPPGGVRGFPRQRRGEVDFYTQLLTDDGTPLPSPTGEDTDTLPISDAERLLAARGEGRALREATVGGSRVRLLTEGVPGGGAIQLGRPLREVDTTLGHIRWILLVVALGGIALAVVLGRLIAARAMSPLARLTSTARSTRPRRRTSGAGSRTAGRTRSAAWRRASTRCRSRCARSTRRSTRSAS